jgi:hypothetical protein
MNNALEKAIKRIREKVPYPYYYSENERIESDLFYKSILTDLVEEVRTEELNYMAERSKDDLPESYIPAVEVMAKLDKELDKQESAWELFRRLEKKQSYLFLKKYLAAVFPKHNFGIDQYDDLCTALFYLYTIPAKKSMVIMCQIEKELEGKDENITKH